MDKFDVIIIGGGAVGAAIAWHLAADGQSCLLCERQQLTSGTTWHAAGLIGQARLSVPAVEIARYSMDYIKDLQQRLDIDMGLRLNGSLSIALNDERLHEFRRGAALSGEYGIQTEDLSVDALKERFGYLGYDNVVGGLLIHGDGQVNPIDLTQAMAKDAKAKGAVIKEHCAVKQFIIEQGNIVGVETDTQTFMAKKVVVAAGMWTRDLCKTIGVNVPLHAAEHFYIVSEPSSDMPSNMPVIRVPDEYAYYKEDAGKLLLGAFEPRAKPFSMKQVKGDFAFETLPEDFDHFEEVFTYACARFPLLENLGMQLFFNGPESFTPDDQFHLGRHPLMQNLYICAGFNSIGIQTSPGAGKAIAETILHGYPASDLSAHQPERMHYYQNNATFLWERTKETLGLLYQPHFPYRQYETGRDLRRTPFHHYVKEAGAVFGETGGWERPNFYALDASMQHYKYSWGRQNWHEAARQESCATRDDVALYDQTSFGKFLVQGKDSLALLQYISCNQIDVALGKAVYTQWLNEHGGIEADLTITRISEHEFLVVTGAAVETRDFMRLQATAQQFDHVFVMNVTNQYPMLGLMGPNARPLLESLSEEDLSLASFPFGTSRLCALGMYEVRLTRLTFVGESGFEIYCPSDIAQQVFELLQQKGQNFNLRLAGYHALNGCRLEKGFRHFGHDIAWHDNLQQAGLSFTARPNAKNFIGRDAFLRAKEAGTPTRRLVQFTFKDTSDNAPLVYHDEPIYYKNTYIGNVTSGNWGYRLGVSMGMGYMKHHDNAWDSFLQEDAFSINVAGTHHAITAQLQGFYDPKHTKMLQEGA